MARQLEPRGRGVLGQVARLAHAVDHDVLADHVLRRLVPAERPGAQAECPRVRLHQGPALLDGRHARSVRRRAPRAVDDPAADHGHAEDGHHDQRDAARSARGLGGRDPEQRHLLLGADGAGVPRGHRRWRVLRIHALHLLLLPPADGGDGPRHPGRHRQLRRFAGATAHPAAHRICDDRGPADAQRAGQGGPAGLVPERRLHLGAVRAGRRSCCRGGSSSRCR